MKISIIGPTNINNLSKATGRTEEEIKVIAENIGRILAEGGYELITMYNYGGILKLVGDSYRKAGGKLSMLYTENDWDWDTKPYMVNLKNADNPIVTKDWHELLWTLVTKSDIVLCTGLSSGVFTEIGYMNWNFHEGKGAKKLFGIRELIRDGKFPVELSLQVGDFAEIISYKEIALRLSSF